MFGWLKRPEPEQSGVPADLAASIQSATVVFRSDDGEGCPRCLVRISGMGAFYFDGTNEAAARIERHTGLHPATCRRAAKLLASVVAAKNRGEFKQPRQRRSSWVFNGWSEL